MKAYSSHRDFQWPLLGRTHGRNAETCCSASLQSVSRGLSPAEKETPKKLHAAPSPSDARNERRRTSVARLDAANDASRIAPSRWWVPAEQSYASTAEATIRPSAAGHRASSRYSPDSLAPSAASTSNPIDTRKTARSSEIFGGDGGNSYPRRRPRSPRRTLRSQNVIRTSNGLVVASQGAFFSITFMIM
jgi:hypothetical protein